MSKEDGTCISGGHLDAILMLYMRHPLQELTVDIFVPNDTFLLGGAGIGAAIENTNDEAEEEDGSDNDYRFMKNSVMVCTGANACGKVLAQARLAGGLIHH